MEAAPLCTQCGKRFASRQAYAGHYRIHVADLRRAAASASSPENANLQESPENVLLMMSERAKLPESDIASSSTEPAKPELSASCRFCKKRFLSARALAGHMRWHQERECHGVNPPKESPSSTNSFKDFPAKPEPSAHCRVCKKRFLSARALAGHMRWHPERECRGINPPTESPSSTGSFKDFPAKPEPSAPCRVCNKSFPSAMALNGHMRCHPERECRGINPPTESPSSTGSFEDVPAKPKPSAPCRVCNKSFPSAMALNGHMRCHPERECRGINPPTESPSSTGSFEDVPAKPKPSAPCRVCKKSFPSVMALNGHMRCHPEREWRGISPPTESPSSAGSREDFPLSWSRKGRRGQLPSSVINAVEALLELSHNVRGETIRVSEKKRSSGESSPQTPQLLEDRSAPKQINSITITEVAAGNRNFNAVEALLELSHNVRGEIIRVSEKKRSSGESTPPTLQLLEDLSVPKQINSITITEAAAGSRNVNDLEKKRKCESDANYASDSGKSYAPFENKKLKIKNTVESL